VVCAARHPGSATENVTWIEADFTQDSDKSRWLARLTGVDAVVNSVGIFKESGAQTFQSLHTDTPRALFAACVEARVRTVIQVSALGADEEATTAYHLSKKAADDYLATLPLDGYIVQPSLVYGKDGVSAATFRMLASMPFTLRFGRRPQLVQPIHVDDVCAAIVGLLRRPAPLPPGRIALVGPRALPFTDYLAALRRALGLGRLRVLTLPDALARLAAKAGGMLPGGLLDPDALSMLDRGNSADSSATRTLAGRPLRELESFIEAPALERVDAKLAWLLPLLRLSIAFVWIATAIVSYGVYPVERSYLLLWQTGIPPLLQPLMLYGAATFDLLLGVAILLVRRRWIWHAQLALIGFYTVVIAIRLPEFLIHPYGPLTKNIPMLAAIWLLAELEEK
jgi:uncharacterized protein YbjT (DUF2867 family)